MCQLLGMNCNTPTDIVFSFEGFHRRGGLTDHHADGWGIAFFEGCGCRLFIDDRSSVDSPLARLVRDYPLKSTNIIAHIRKATQGEVKLANAHPFMRELWGRYWIFAHNGDLKDYQPAPGQYYRPVGCTDSERAFCAILEALRQRWDAPPSEAELFDALAALAADIAAHGVFNFMLSNGAFLAAHCSTNLHYILRQSPFNKAHLVDDDVTVDFAQVTTPNDRVAVIATQPLTDNETWTPLSPGEFVLFKDGEPARRQGKQP
ncbi:MAG: class II glutamine amidotransferase [Paludibacterium sp.]|uniref:class II glutamine amidotransferase n=1 Tax=Paludibacterium sp. TaxID=1917523 RepID=UPI0025D3DCF3|nr:class II glutamine amidotransferase [Paludibacterium sp.]MBV8047578.1 class II glutamine amidotransferase [Paludibacterium sp.]MBV8646323.1 class II glutamine amidotransferase [Paludibacterium sp.]